MAVLICSPRTVERVKRKEENRHYNSLNFILKNAEKLQTPYTPNVLNIHLLQEVMKSRQKIRVVSDRMERRMSSWIKTIRDHPSLELLVKNDSVRSFTVLAVKAPAKVVGHFHAVARDAGFVLGQGYGDLKTTTFRIANFPALTDLEIARLQDLFRKQDQ